MEWEKFSMQIDRLTYAIVGRLSRDATQRRKKIATELNISEGSLSKRISNLIDEKIIKRFTVELDLNRLGINFHAVSFITLDHQSGTKLQEILAVLKNLRSATEYATLFGDHDIFVRWMCRNNEHLDTELQALLEIDGVQIETHAFGSRTYRQANIFSAVIE